MVHKFWRYSHSLLRNMMTHIACQFSVAKSFGNNIVFKLNFSRLQYFKMISLFLVCHTYQEVSDITCLGSPLPENVQYEFYIKLLNFLRNNRLACFLFLNALWMASNTISIFLLSIRTSMSTLSSVHLLILNCVFCTYTWESFLPMQNNL